MTKSRFLIVGVSSVVLLIGSVADIGGTRGLRPDPWPVNQIRDTLLDTLGVPPSSCIQHPGAVVSREPVEKSNLGTILRIAYSSCGAIVPALLAIPGTATRNTPVIIALHQTTDLGKREVMGVGGDPALAFGKKFYAAGFVVLAPDEFSAGENFDPAMGWDTSLFYKLNPRWSAMGKMLADHKAAVDALVALERFPRCIAAVGHSLGGHNALMLAALEPRIDAAVSSGGFEEMRMDDHAERWSRSAGFIYMPALRRFVSGPAPHAVPWDWKDVLRAILPRPIMLVQGTKDKLWTHPLSVLDAASKVRQAYSGHDRDLLVRTFEGSHSFPSRLQAEAVDFVRSACMHKE